MELLSEFYTHPTLFLIGLGMLGLIIGSFLNVIIYRLPIMLEGTRQRECAAYLAQDFQKTSNITFCKPRSFCPKCYKTLSVWMNIPILSYLFLRGKCFYCKKSINPRYPLIEIISCLITLSLGIYFGPTLKLIAGLFFVWSMIVLIFIDIDIKELPDEITITLLWLGLFFNIYHLFTSLADAVLGAIAGYLFFFFVAWLYQKIRKREGLGHGDFKLLASLGAWFGWQAIPMIIFIASFIGAIFSIIYIFATKQGYDTKIPFGPFLIMGGIVIMFWAKVIYNSNLFLHSYL